jgi:hypothetical protein
MTTQKNLNIETPKTFIVISSPREDLAVGLAITLTENKQKLNDTFNGRKLPHWPSMVNHMPGGANKEELLDSIHSVINEPKNFMMVLSGYENNEEWNNALTTVLSSHNLSATFLSHEGTLPPQDLKNLFHYCKELHSDPEQAENSSVPISETKFGKPIPLIH